MVRDIMKNLLKERPVGSKNNRDILLYLENLMMKMGYDIKKLPFTCTTCETGESCLTLNDRRIEIQASPFSQPFEGSGRLVFVKSLEELETADCHDCILVVGGEMVATPLQPKEYPFYYPEEHRYLIELFERKQPAAIIAATGKHALCGLQPFPLFEDGNFLIPSAYVPEAMFEELQGNGKEGVARVSIQTKNKQQNSYQLVAQKRNKSNHGKIIVCAHMDTKYRTQGALDNAVGVVVLLEAAARLVNSNYNIDIVPFNGEEYYEASGEVEYLKYISSRQDKVSLVINIDSPCHAGSKIAVSLYNFDDSAREVVGRLMQTQNEVVYGPEWYAGDHAAFAFREIPCMVLTSSDLFEGGLDNTHTMRDTLDTVDLSQVELAANFINQAVAFYK
ncbi:MAG: M28 family peptidase [Eubacterium sp.]|nr:M28 family peptidase [Eubacterium sp.]